MGYTKHEYAETPDLFVRKISVEGTLDDNERERLLAIAERCPVHRTLERGANIEALLGEPPADSSSVETHTRTMELVDDQDAAKPFARQLWLIPWQLLY